MMTCERPRSGERSRERSGERLRKRSSSAQARPTVRTIHHLLSFLRSPFTNVFTKVARPRDHFRRPLVCLFLFVPASLPSEPLCLLSEGKPPIKRTSRTTQPAGSRSQSDAQAQDLFAPTPSQKSKRLMRKAAAGGLLDSMKAQPGDKNKDVM
jgi:hypothetical protein